MAIDHDYPASAPASVSAHVRLSATEIEHRRKAMRSAIASAELAGGKINDDTWGLMTLFALGEIRENEMMARIHAIYGAKATPERVSAPIEALSERELALIEASRVEVEHPYSLESLAILEGLGRRG